MTPSNELIQPCLGAPDVDRGVKTNGSFQPSERNVRNESGRQLSALASPKMDSIATSNGVRSGNSSGINAVGLLKFVVGRSTAFSGAFADGTSIPRLPRSVTAGSCARTGLVENAMANASRQMKSVGWQRERFNFENTLAPPPAGVNRFANFLISSDPSSYRHGETVVHDTTPGMNLNKITILIVMGILSI